MGKLERVPGKQNWVDNAGGLPKYIERIAVHLHEEKGYEIGRSIAVAVNACKRMCGSGDLNFKGKQNVNAKSRAQACAAIAEWEAKKMKSKVNKGDRLTISDEEFADLAKEFLGEDIEKHGQKGEPGYRALHPKSKRSQSIKDAMDRSSRGGRDIYNSVGQGSEGMDSRSAAKALSGDRAAARSFTNEWAKMSKPDARREMRSLSDEDFDNLLRILGRSQSADWNSTSPSAAKTKRIALYNLARDERERRSGGVQKSDDTEEFSQEFTIAKQDSDKRLVFGYASMGIDNEGNVLIDKQGDIIDDPEHMENAAYNFVMHSRTGGEMHIRKGVSTLVESFMVTPEKMNALSMIGDLPEEVMKAFPQAAWWVGFKVTDSGVWEKIKKGEYPMFSVHGLGVRKAIEGEEE